jgi:hypothetical protein
MVFIVLHFHLILNRLKLPVPDQIISVFTIDGCYSNRTSRIGLTKSYQLGTGNRSQNFGHQVLIQLVWNSETRQFEGKWYVQTKKYRAEDKFELKFSNQQQLSPYEKV